ncbi:hypothetical protein LRP49_01630 [Enterovibrio sp. ZSDZ35]|uniref:Formate-dependent nitrite reductase complex subunit NrfG n=1 Tax=Enterovibrio qingdaonensis TaxID=2899818 RepID=A0ABT5QFY2_9GAMM|nr:hypothetical protein [Enterovibrio sp. ZSDZ35]MDD1779885.1 hypothetical protein [Enterovibrio sp. ZSDZ35]
MDFVVVFFAFCCCLTVAATAAAFKRRSQKVGVFLILSSFSLIAFLSTSLYHLLGEPALALISQSDTSTKNTTNSISNLEKLQSALREEKQNGALWFELGGEYMDRGEFENASLVYHYAEKLSDTPNADIYAARASARYYQQHQRLDSVASDWLKTALEIDDTNVSALTLIATDHYLSGQYQKAIDTWVRVLDANHSSTDRESIITSINHAKAML